MAAVRTTCPYCGVGCGVLATPGADYDVVIQGDDQHPANFGRLCSKGSALGETVDLDGRLLYPQIHGERASWETALEHVAAGFRRVIDQHGPEAVAFYVSGQLLTEDYYVANKLMKGFIGSANIDTNSRLCMASSVAGHKRAFGSDIVPGNYEDLEQAELLVLVGSNTAWCHPVLFQRMRAAREKANRPCKLIVIDPRRTATCDGADLHLPLNPGSDAVLFNGLLTYLFQNGRADFDFLEAHTEGYGQALHAARDGAATIPAVASACGLSEAAVAEFYGLFARIEKTVTVYSQGVNQSSSGTDKVNAIINCHLATGRIGRAGMGPFSVTGQPNAMGGREVGGLANQLAAHMDFTAPDLDKVRRFWQAPRVATQAGLKAVDMFRAIGDGRIKAVWIMATNPVVSMPDADAVRTALRRCELVVVSDCITRTDTTALAHVLLPALAWGEKEGTVTNSERRISRQRAFLPPPGEAKADWWIVSAVARHMGYGAAFDYRSAADVFREHAALSACGNGGTRAFDLSALAELSDEGYQRMQPVQWPVTAANPAGTPRLFGDGRFFTASGKARFVAVTPRLPEHPVAVEYPFVLNTGRVRDHWHTLTRTGKSPRLSAHTVEPYAELHPRDAARLGVREGTLVRLTSRWGAMFARAVLSEGQRPGQVFVPMHWTAQYAAHGRVDALVNPATDPVSGQPELKHTPVQIERYTPKWHGFILSRQRLASPAADYWVMAAGTQFRRYELAGDRAPTEWGQWARTALGAEQQPGEEWVEYLDAGAGRYRGVRVLSQRIESCVFIAPGPELPPRSWLSQLFMQDSLSASDRMSLLTGLPPKDRPDPGRVVCSCFGVGINTITRAIRERGLTNVEMVGQALKAGTNCGSCLPELKALLTAQAASSIS